MKKKSKRFLSLVLSLAICMGTLIMPAHAEDDARPEFPLADVAVPVTIAEGRPWESTVSDFIRISHAVAQETVKCDGEPLDLYSIYPNAAVWKTCGLLSGSTYAAVKWCPATLENGELKTGEPLNNFEPERPSDSCWLRWSEEDIGSYYIVEILDSSYSAKFGIHIVEGYLPENVPTYYVYDVGLSKDARLTEGNVWVVPAGTVATLPYDSDFAYVWSMEPYPTRKAALDAIYGSGERPSTTDVETYMCNGRECFTVESGKMYHVNYWQSNILNIDGFLEVSYNEAHIFIVGEDNAPTTPTAYAATQTVKVDGKDVTFYAYKLVDENGGETNYVKLRDVAAILSGTKGQFEVGWDGAINLEAGKPYTTVGGELVETFTGNQPYGVCSSPVNVNGAPADLEAITLTDAAGGEYNYFKLRDLGKALGFNVGYDPVNDSVFIETDKPYDPNN